MQKRLRRLPLSGQPALSQPPAGQPTFTYAGGWSLVELERHLQAGDVTAISATSSSPAAGNAPDGLVVKTRDGQIVTINLAVSAGQAVSALSGLGYGNLLTTEALAAGRSTTVAEGAPNPMAIILPLLMVAAMVVLFTRMSRRNGPAARESSSGFSTIMPADPNARPTGDAAKDATIRMVATLDDVAGCDEAKLELTEAIDFLRSPERFHLLAQARKLGRGVIFLDEFDALGKARGGPNSHEEREQTLNQLLVELDGFGTTDDVIVIAATNRLDVLDSAVLRPGRFNRKIHVGLPDVKGRKAILEVHARNKPIAMTVDLGEMARKTYGFSGAQLADLLNEAAIIAARRMGDLITADDLHAGWLKVAVGTSRRRSMY